MNISKTDGLNSQAHEVVDRSMQEMDRNCSDTTECGDHSDASLVTNSMSVLTHSSTSSPNPTSTAPFRPPMHRSRPPRRTTVTYYAPAPTTSVDPSFASVVSSGPNLAPSTLPTTVPSHVSTLPSRDADSAAWAGFPLGPPPPTHPSATRMPQCPLEVLMPCLCDTCTHSLTAHAGQSAGDRTGVAEDAAPLSSTRGPSCASDILDAHLQAQWAAHMPAQQELTAANDTPAHGLRGTQGPRASARYTHAHDPYGSDDTPPAHSAPVLVRIPVAVAPAISATGACTAATDTGENRICMDDGTVMDAAIGMETGEGLGTDGDVEYTTALAFGIDPIHRPTPAWQAEEALARALSASALCVVGVHGVGLSALSFDPLARALLEAAQASVDESAHTGEDVWVTQMPARNRFGQPRMGTPRTHSAAGAPSATAAHGSVPHGLVFLALDARGHGGSSAPAHCVADACGTRQRAIRAAAASPRSNSSPSCGVPPLPTHSAFGGANAAYHLRYRCACRLAGNGAAADVLSALAWLGVTAAPQRTEPVSVALLGHSAGCAVAATVASAATHWHHYLHTHAQQSSAGAGTGTNAIVTEISLPFPLPPELAPLATVPPSLLHGLRHVRVVAVAAVELHEEAATAHAGLSPFVTHRRGPFLSPAHAFAHCAASRMWAPPRALGTAFTVHTLNPFAFSRPEDACATTAAALAPTTTASTPDTDTDTMAVQTISAAGDTLTSHLPPPPAAAVDLAAPLPASALPLVSAASIPAPPCSFRPLHCRSCGPQLPAAQCPTCLVCFRCDPPQTSLAATLCGMLQRATSPAATSTHSATNCVGWRFPLSSARGLWPHWYRHCTQRLLALTLTPPLPRPQSPLLPSTRAAIPLGVFHPPTSGALVTGAITTAHTTSSAVATVPTAAPALAAGGPAASVLANPVSNVPPVCSAAVGEPSVDHGALREGGGSQDGKSEGGGSEGGGSEGGGAYHHSTPLPPPCTIEPPLATPTPMSTHTHAPTPMSTHTHAPPSLASSTSSATSAQPSATPRFTLRLPPPPSPQRNPRPGMGPLPLPGTHVPPPATAAAVFAPRVPSYCTARTPPLPVLVLQARAEHVAAALAAAHMRGRVQVQVVPGTHCVHEDRPRACAGVLWAFLRRAVASDRMYTQQA